MTTPHKEPATVILRTGGVIASKPVIDEFMKALADLRTKNYEAFEAFVGICRNPNHPLPADARNYLTKKRFLQEHPGTALFRYVTRLAAVDRAGKIELELPYEE